MSGGPWICYHLQREKLLEKNEGYNIDLKYLKSPLKSEAPKNVLNLLSRLSRLQHC